MVLLGPALQEHLPHSEEHVLKGHEGPVLAVRFNTQGTYCLSCGKVRAARPACPGPALQGSPLLVKDLHSSNLGLDGS